jgi:hypothetical protein
MLTTPRWIAEVSHMRNNVPSFRPFAVPGVHAGFEGYLIGPRTRTRYHVTVRAILQEYPAKEPAVYIEPHPERHHWIQDNRLCYQREGHVWNQAEDTFAQAVAMAVKYIAEFDVGPR